MTRTSQHRPSRALWAGALALALAAVGCGGHTNVVCVTDLDCQSSLICVADPGFAEARCLKPCEASTRLCDDGSVCLDFAGGRACYPGGAVAFGERCARTIECEAGTVCPASLGRCAQACDGVSAICALMERCIDDEEVGLYCGE